MDKTVLKEHDIFLVSETAGDIAAENADGQGLYFRDTRFLSLYELTIEGVKPTLLSAAGELNFMTNLQFANPALVLEDGQAVEPRTISIRRNRFIHKGVHERIGLHNYNQFPVTLRVRLVFGADFRDMFDVRGYQVAPRRGTISAPAISPSKIKLCYSGLDGIDRTTVIHFQPEPTTIEVTPSAPVEVTLVTPPVAERDELRMAHPAMPPRAAATFALSIPPGQVRSITIRIEPRIEAPEAVVQPEENDSALDVAFRTIRASYERWQASATEIVSDDELFNIALRRASHDLRLLSERAEGGYVPSAGIPWFSVPFGRDSLITAAQTLILQPAVATGTLRFLAKLQGTKVDDWRDEEPGKILHEIRQGELAALKEVPHTPYYGSVDSTPLFLVVLGEYLDWTNDEALARELRPNAEAALDWIDHYGDHDGCGYVEYKTRSVRGIRNQGWKDSHDSVTHRDGRHAELPIALAEVQGYVYDAKRRMAGYFRRLGDRKRADELERQAADLKARFLRDFWLEDERYFAIALDGEKRPVRQVSSNPGHCLWSGLIDGPAAEATARRLVTDDLLSGWGVRTLSSRERNFNPMSYHNGSVWPHDNSIIAAGLGRAGFPDEAARVMSEVIDAAKRFPDYRLPELYCGFGRDRRYFSMPARYPVSCSPQAWAAGSLFLFVQTMIGLRVDAAAGKVYVRPHLVGSMNRLTIRRLRVGNGSLDLIVFRDGERTRVEVLAAEGVDVVVEEEPSHTSVG